MDFIGGEFSLNERDLTNDEIKASCGKKIFQELDESYKNKIWEYPISIVVIDSECTIADIKEMFYRLNLTNYSLNRQEKETVRIAYLEINAKRYQHMIFGKRQNYLVLPMQRE